MCVATVLWAGTLTVYLEVETYREVCEYTIFHNDNAFTPSLTVVDPLGENADRD